VARVRAHRQRARRARQRRRAKLAIETQAD
jgi:hypothetical protein